MNAPHRKRVRSYNIAGHAHELTFSCFRRLPLLVQMIEYIHNNPVRRRLVRKATDWIWSSARFYAGATRVPIRMDPLPCLNG